MDLFSWIIDNFETLLTWTVPFLVVLTVIVFIHELGHFMVARWCGVAVEAFSIGFGREIFGFTDRKGTRWKFSWIPLGGYVKFVGDENAASMPDRESLEDMDDEVRKHSFYHKPVGQRAAVVAAGPIANFLLAIVIFAGLFMTYGWHATSPLVEELIPGGVAEESGFQVNDVVVSIDGKEIETFADMQNIVRLSAGTRLSIVVRRGEELVTLDATPRKEVQKSIFGDQEIGLLGIKRPTQGDMTIKDVSFLTAVRLGTEKTWEIGAQSLKFFGRLIVGQEKASNMGGPARIAYLSAKIFEIGIEQLIHLAAVLSVSIGLINLFPIPMLDGGHLMYYGIEAVRGKPLSEKMQELGFRVGLGVIAALMIFVTTMDLIFFNS